MNIAGASGYYKVNSEQSVSFSFRYFSMGDLQETDDNLQALGERSPYEMVMDVAYARRLGRNFSMSMTFRYGVSNVVKKYRRAHIIAADLGGYYSKALRFGEKFRICLPLDLHCQMSGIKSSMGRMTVCFCWQS